MSAAWMVIQANGEKDESAVASTAKNIIEDGATQGHCTSGQNQSPDSRIYFVEVFGEALRNLSARTTMPTRRSR